MTNLVQAGRLALRVEGDRWIAYFAPPDTMEGAHFLGAIHMAAVTNNAARKHEFMELMQAVVSDLILYTTGEASAWPDPPVPAPEHERSGRS